MGAYQQQPTTASPGKKEQAKERLRLLYTGGPFPTRLAKGRKEEKTMIYDTSGLIKRIYSRYGSIKAFAQQIGLTETALALRLCGAREFSAAEMTRAVYVLEIPKDAISEYFFREI